MNQIELKIDSERDRRELAAILADNGYKVVVSKVTRDYEDNYFLIIEIDDHK